MINNIEQYALQKEISQQDALQVFMQVVVLKNLHPGQSSLIGGTSLVMGSNNPRFSEDIDLTGVEDPLKLQPYLIKSKRVMEGLLGGSVNLVSPKPSRGTWRILFNLDQGMSARLHIDTQPYSPLTSHSLMVEYPGIAPFVFPSVEVDEIMADKLIAMAFRKNISGRDIFDLWYHWLKNENFVDRIKLINSYVEKKLKLRSLKESDYRHNIKDRLKENLSARVKDEWERYLPVGLRNEALYEQIFDKVQKYFGSNTL